MNRRTKLINEIANLILSRLDEEVDGSSYYDYYSIIKKSYNEDPNFKGAVRRHLTDYFNNLPEPKPLYIRDIKDVFEQMAYYCEENRIPVEEVKDRLFEILNSIVVKY